MLQLQASIAQLPPIISQMSSSAAPSGPMASPHRSQNPDPFFCLGYLDRTCNSWPTKGSEHRGSGDCLEVRSACFASCYKKRKRRPKSKLWRFTRRLWISTVDRHS
jgi:hypothetical protein